MVRPLPFAPPQLSVRLPEPSVLPVMVAVVTGEGAPNGRATALVFEVWPAPSTFEAEIWKV